MDELLQKLILETLLGSPGAPSAAELLADEERRDIRASQMSDRFLPSEGPPLARLLMGVPMSMRLLARENAERRGGSFEDADRLAATMNPLSELFSHEDRAGDLRTLALLEELGILGSPPARTAEEDPQAAVEALFLSRLAQPDATRVSPDAGRRSVPSLADVGRETARVGREAVTGLPGLLRDMFMDFQRDPLGTQPAVSAAEAGNPIMAALLAAAGALNVAPGPVKPTGFIRGVPRATRREIIDDFLRAGPAAEEIVMGAPGQVGGQRGRIIEEFLTGGTGREAREATNQQMEELIRDRLINILTGGGN